MASGLAHRLEQRHGPTDIVMVIEQRLGDGFAHGLETGEVDHGGDGMRSEDATQRSAVANVGALENRRVTCDAADALDDERMTIDEIIDDDDAEASAEEFDAGVRTDISGATGDEDYAGFLRHGAEGTRLIWRKVGAF